MFSPFKRKPRVLLLDDDPSMQRLVSTLLRRAGHRVDIVGKGQDAIEAIDRQRYDAILLDLMMPHEGGMTVLKHLREKDAPMLKRVIILTATSESVLKSIDPDVFAVVRKPFDPAGMTETVKRLTAK